MREKLNTCNFPNFLPAPQILFLALFSLHYQYLGGFGGAFKSNERRKYLLRICLFGFVIKYVRIFILLKFIWSIKVWTHHDKTPQKNSNENLYISQLHLLVCDPLSLFTSFTPRINSFETTLSMQLQNILLVWSADRAWMLFLMGKENWYMIHTRL